MEAVVLVSGGLDSCVAAAVAHAQGWILRVAHVGYGQRTEERERRAAEQIADHYGVPEHRRLYTRIGHLAQIGASSLTDHSIPVMAAGSASGQVPSSYVPFRNAHLLSIAVSWAEAVGAERVVIGAVSVDSSGYPDCRPEYYDAFNELVRLGTMEGRIRVVTPLLYCSKAEVVARGIQLAAPLHLTWSCYQAEDQACGVCASCVLRLRGFEEAGLGDPIPYRSIPPDKA